MTKCNFKWTHIPLKVERCTFGTCSIQQTSMLQVVLSHLKRCCNNWKFSFGARKKGGPPSKYNIKCLLTICIQQLFQSPILLRDPEQTNKTHNE